MNNSQENNGLVPNVCGGIIKDDKPNSKGMMVGMTLRNHTKYYCFPFDETLSRFVETFTKCRADRYSRYLDKPEYGVITLYCADGVDVSLRVRYYPDSWMIYSDLFQSIQDIYVMEGVSYGEESR